MEKIPTHVALIMDGNRRWAKQKKLPTFIGHKKGEEGIEPVIDQAIEMGIKYLTFWAFSTENWDRKKDEVNFLMNLYRHNLDKKIKTFHKKNIKIKIIGNLKMFPQDIQEKTVKWMEDTKNNKKITVNFALSYGGRDEIIRAVNKILKVKHFGKDEKEITKEIFEKYLDTNGQPDPDLIIRTGGVMRMSGFLLWQMEYAELYFTDILWPDFSPFEFKKAVIDYQNRKRRYGK
jgi:undecaprenyl diphosphate synthase